MSVNTLAADLLDKAADILRVNGRTTGDLQKAATGKCCPLGAISLAGDLVDEAGLPLYPLEQEEGTPEHVTVAVRALADRVHVSDYAPQAERDLQADVWRWNDGITVWTAVTDEDVIATLREVAQSLRSAA